MFDLPQDTICGLWTCRVGQVDVITIKLLVAIQGRSDHEFKVRAANRPSTEESDVARSSARSSYEEP